MGIVSISLIAVGIFAWWQYSEIGKNRLPENSKEVEGEAAYWEVYQHEEWGFSMRIHLDYVRTEEKETKKQGTGDKVESVTFSSGQGERVVLIFDRELGKSSKQQIINSFESLSSDPEETFEGFKSAWEMMYAVEVISLEKFEKDNCVGIQVLERGDVGYDRDLILVSRNLEDMYIMIVFQYYNKDTESKIMEMIGTIRCAK